MIKRTLLLAMLASSCTQQIDVEQLKQQLRDEITAESAVPSASPEPTPETTPSPTPEPTPAPTVEPTPIPGSESAAIAMEALFKMQSQVRAGLNTTGYTSAVAELSAEFDRAKRVGPLEQHPAHESLEKAHTEYRRARTLWQCHFQFFNFNNFLPEECVMLHGPSLIRDYNVRHNIIGGKTEIILDYALDAYWSTASRYIAEAEQALN